MAKTDEKFDWLARKVEHMATAIESLQRAREEDRQFNEFLLKKVTELYVDVYPAKVLK